MSLPSLRGRPSVWRKNNYYFNKTIAAKERAGGGRRRRRQVERVEWPVASHPSIHVAFSRGSRLALKRPNNQLMFARLAGERACARAGPERGRHRSRALAAQTLVSAAGLPPGSAAAAAAAAHLRNSRRRWAPLLSAAGRSLCAGAEGARPSSIMDRSAARLANVNIMREVVMSAPVRVGV